jgi:hypothetical protein
MKPQQNQKLSNTQNVKIKDISFTYEKDDIFDKFEKISQNKKVTERK